LLDFLKPKETRVKELVNELYRKGWNLEAEKKYEEAVQVYDQVINLNPQYVSVHISKGDALRKMKNYEEAIRTYNKANGIKQDGDAYAGIGFALMGLDRYEEAIEYFRDSNAAYIEKSDDDFWADYEANQDDYAPGALEAHFKNHPICGGYEIKKFHELMEKKCEQLVNAGKYREAIKVAYDGLGVVDTPWESYCRYVDRSLEAMGERRMADEFYDKYFEAEDTSRWGENDKAREKMRSAVWHVKNQLNIKNESYHIIIDYPDDPVNPSTTPRASDFSSQLPKIIKRHAQKLVTGTIIFFVVFGILSLIDWNNNDSENTHQNILPAPISIASAKLAPVIEWQKCLGGSDIDQALSVQQTSDGGYIVGGRSNSTDGDVTGNHGGYDPWVVKLSTSGNIEWQKCLGSSGFDEGASSVQQTSDGGYIVAGTTTSNDGDVTGNHGDMDSWVVKLDTSGNIEWQKSLGGSDTDGALSI